MITYLTHTKRGSTLQRWGLERGGLFMNGVRWVTGCFSEWAIDVRGQPSTECWDRFMVGSAMRIYHPLQAD